MRAIVTNFTYFLILLGLSLGCDQKPKTDEESSNPATTPVEDPAKEDPKVEDPKDSDDETVLEPTPAQLLADEILNMMANEGIGTKTQQEEIRVAVYEDVAIAVNPLELSSQEQVARSFVQHMPWEDVEFEIDKYSKIVFEEILDSVPDADHDDMALKIALAMLSPATVGEIPLFLVANKLGELIGAMYIPSIADISMAGSKYDEFLIPVMKRSIVLSENESYWVFMEFLAGLGGQLFDHYDSTAAEYMEVGEKFIELMVAVIEAGEMDYYDRYSSAASLSDAYFSYLYRLTDDFTGAEMLTIQTAFNYSLAYKIAPLAVADDNDYFLVSDVLGRITAHIDGYYRQPLSGNLDDFDFGALYTNHYSALADAITDYKAVEVNADILELAVRGIANSTTFYMIENYTETATAAGMTDAMEAIVTTMFPAIESHLTAIELGLFCGQVMENYYFQIGAANFTNLMNAMRDAGDDLITDNAKKADFINLMTSNNIDPACQESEYLSYDTDTDSFICQ